MEACATAHYWAREIGKLGHEVRLLPPAYVKPFVKRQKYDAADAEAIVEAAMRPSMRFVMPKAESQQASAMIFRTRDLFVRQSRRLSMPCARTWACLRGSPWLNPSAIWRKVGRISKPPPKALMANTAAWDGWAMAAVAIMVMFRLQKSTADTADRRAITTA